MSACKPLFYALIVWSLYLCDALLSDMDILSNFGTCSEGMERIRLIYYKGTEKDNVSHNYTLDRSEELMKHLDLQKPFVLYIHGYEENLSSEGIRTIVSAYLQRGSDNIIVLDWSECAFGNYVTVAMRVKDISKYTAKAFGKLAVAGLNVDTLHVVGHSLGAQVAGFIGQHLNFTIPRITGLDPANPMFYQFGAEHISAKSGRIVDIIHTDGGIYGAYRPTGTVDFFANGGCRPQPGCDLFGVPLTPRSLCSHWRSWGYYAESVINVTSFPAVECRSYASLLRDECKMNRFVYFGYSMPKNINGTYYFTTNANSPYGQGLAGIRRKT